MDSSSNNNVRTFSPRSSLTARDPGLAFTDGSMQFEAWSEALWDPAARTIVAATQLKEGERVLDACCGSGAATIPAALAVGASGSVDGVDLSSGLLASAGKKLGAAHILNTTLTHADVTAWRGHRTFDAVLCSYSIFFFQDMSDGVAHLLSMLRPDGRIVLNTWVRGALSPLAELILQAAITERPRLAEVIPLANQNMDLISNADSLHDWLAKLGLTAIEVETHPLKLSVDAEMAWALVMGSGWRTLLPRDPDAIARVSKEFLGSIRALGSQVEFNSDTLVAKASKA
ncbi:methyltransferase, UbiE/COQ5 family [Renibacterium salmoninarum ATCC 33209]|uniref:Methyltransferase, UbiE/COQ5 family n=1 Tax=Renibacterium salmoninarum (strain ATCC 33209 / DSM 20767 / JCM 11484 / NBRC 15589 / NCIMB 2235) TaxID=288705 RepID=A9WPR3_RENSM|nr:class I SAM-dependent methyltransferase [Renibacterium salmoninarum]ABY23021.1 methyltransferase, UbiE/COQ5 family [Renibacterium salmoninarum ATCC 33209]